MSMVTDKRRIRRTKLPDLNRQVAQAKAVLRQLRDTLEDLDDRRDLARARKKNAGKAGTDWEVVKKEMGLEF
ncbi:MAG TPA: hypothetical protein VG754_10545 [Verrucomicrobiae bacterium]|jgi:chromosome segregation ATPase|nr:hypothetical protein [Verrucomicrobiae bacterium]